MFFCCSFPVEPNLYWIIKSKTCCWTFLYHPSANSFLCFASPYQSGNQCKVIEQIYFELRVNPLVTKIQLKQKDFTADFKGLHDRPLDSRLWLLNKNNDIAWQLVKAVRCSPVTLMVRDKSESLACIPPKQLAVWRQPRPLWRRQQGLPLVTGKILSERAVSWQPCWEMSYNTDHFLVLSNLFNL